VSLLSDALGGYIGLELPDNNDFWLSKALKFNSARAAFASLVEQIEARSVWLPRYLCDTMSAILSGRGVELKFYDLTERFEIKEHLRVDEGSIILFVNYFGVCSQQAQDVIDKYGADSAVIDNSQALFDEPFDALATIYSPRKFFGLPDGGLLFSDDPRIKQSEFRDTTSESRMGYLISRITESPEAAYQKYQDAEKAICDLPVQGMSRLTEKLLRSVNYDAARVARTRNAQYLERKLREYNKLSLDIGDITAPLCYPFLPNVSAAKRAELIANRVFLPSYWPEVLTRVEEESFEWELVTNGLFLPCDQRYTEEDMERLVSLLAIK
jgi:hypothetical protein